MLKFLPETRRSILFSRSEERLCGAHDPKVLKG
jgi:hypothetical protein